MADPVTVRARSCACPNTPHPEGDLVFLRPTLSLDGGLDAERAMIDSEGDIKRLERDWARIFILDGAFGWNLVDADGEPVPFDADAIVADYSLGRQVADKAADMYASSVIDPFLETWQKASPSGPTTGTTSRRRGRTASSPVPPSPATSAASQP